MIWLITVLIILLWLVFIILFLVIATQKQEKLFHLYVDAHLKTKVTKIEKQIDQNTNQFIALELKKNKTLLLSIELQKVTTKLGDWLKHLL